MAEKSVKKICPLMSAGQSIEVICAKESCAWYMASIKACGICALGYNAILNIKEKQQKK